MNNKYISKYFSMFFISYISILILLLIFFYFTDTTPNNSQLFLLPAIPSIFSSYFLTNRILRITYHNSSSTYDNVQSMEEIIDDKIDSIYFRTFQSLYWFLGVGWPTITTLCIMFIVTLVTKGAFSIIIGTLGSLFLLLSILRCVNWNFPKWKRVHGRGTLLYSEIMGYEMGLAKINNREFDHQLSLDLLARKLSKNKEQWGYKFFSFMAITLKGQLYVEYFIKHIEEINPNLSKQVIDEIEMEFLQFPLSPSMVIIQVIDKKYGSLEAANYAIAVYEGRAR